MRNVQINHTGCKNLLLPNLPLSGGGGGSGKGGGGGGWVLNVRSTVHVEWCLIILIMNGYLSAISFV